MPVKQSGGRTARRNGQAPPPSPPRSCPAPPSDVNRWHTFAPAQTGQEAAGGRSCACSEWERCSFSPPAPRLFFLQRLSEDVLPGQRVYFRRAGRLKRGGQAGTEFARFSVGEGYSHGQVSFGGDVRARTLVPPGCWRNETGEARLPEEADEGPGADPRTPFPGWETAADGRKAAWVGKGYG